MDGMDGGRSLLAREDVFLYELYVTMLNESIDDLLGHRSRATSTKREPKKEIHISRKSGRVPFFSIIPNPPLLPPPFPIPSLPAGGCKFSFTFFRLPAFPYLQINV